MCHTVKVTNYMFYCFSTMADYEYYVRLEEASELDKAMRIADEELSKWGAPDEKELGDDYAHYYNAGYVEIVQEALEREGIEADYFVLMED